MEIRKIILKFFKTNIMKTKLILTTLALCILFSCKKKTEDVTPPAPVDSIAGEWYLHLIEAEGNYGGGSHYAFRTGGINTGNQGNIAFTTNTASKSLFKFTKEAEGKYSISSVNYPGSQLAYQENNILPYSTRLMFSVNPISDIYLYTFEKAAGTTDTYIIKSVSNPTTALSASVTNGSSLRPNFVTAGASFTYQKWKLEK
jgi:hypothetical protein